MHLKKEKSTVLRGIEPSHREGGPRALGWTVRTQVEKRRYINRACSVEEAAYIRLKIENLLGRKRRGNRNLSSFCIPHPVDYSNVKEGYITICGRTFKMRDPWTDEKGEWVARQAWFSYCDRPPHSCRAGFKEDDPGLVVRIPLERIVGRISECTKAKGYCRPPA